METWQLMIILAAVYDTRGHQAAAIMFFIAAVIVVIAELI